MSETIQTKFTFRARTIVDAEGKEIGKAKKQPALTAALPVPTPQEIVDIMCLPNEVVPPKKEGDQPTEVTPKIKLLLLEAIYDIVRSQAKSQLDDVIDSYGADETKTVSVSDLNYDQLTLEYIANLPPAQRGARAITEDEWKAFFADYMHVMVAATGKPETKIKNHIDLFDKPTKVKQNKEALAVLVQQLEIYTATAQNLEEHADCVSRLKGKFEKWIKEDDKLDLEAL